jgi:HlyD family secretion protein
MTCRAEIFTAAKTGVLAAPIQAVIVDEDLTTAETKRYAFVVRGNRAERHDVTTGLSDDTYQEIVSGLNEGDDVIVGPDRVLRGLKDGDRVREAERARP